MIQDIYPYEFHIEYSKEPPEKNSYILSLRNENILVKQSSSLDFPRYSDYSVQGKTFYRYLFSINEDRFYLAPQGEEQIPKGYALLNLNEIKKRFPKHLCFSAAVSVQLNRWYESRTFCGRCKTPMKHHEKERAMYCPNCNLVEYPKISPAVIIAVTHGSRILLSKYAGREYKRYALLAGFAETGETIEETVRREVMEEVGLKVKDLHYYKSQPWPYSDTLLFGFFAELDGADQITLDEEELAYAKWFEREEIPVEMDDFSLTNEMIMQFKNGGKL